MLLMILINNKKYKIYNMHYHCWSLPMSNKWAIAQGRKSLHSNQNIQT